MITNIKIILFILLIMIISVIFILIINNYTTEEFEELSDTLAIPEAQQKSGLIDSGNVLIQSDDKTLNESIMCTPGPPGPPGDKGPRGEDGSGCKCKMPLLKFIDDEDNILAQYPENNYPTPEKIVQDKLVELVIPVPRGRTGDTGRQGSLGPSGFGYPNNIYDI